MIIREFNKLITIILALLIIMVATFILTYGINYYNSSYDKTSNYVKDSVQLVNLTVQNQQTYTYRTIFVNNYPITYTETQQSSNIQSIAVNPTSIPKLNESIIPITIH